MGSMTHIYAIIDDLGVFALLAMGYRTILQEVGQRLVKSLTLGLLFGCGAIFSIGSTNQVSPGVFVDPRGIMLVLAGPFGGPLAATIAAAMAGSFRLYLGGIGAIPGVGNIATAAIAGILFRIMLFREHRPTSLRQLLGLGTASNLGVLFYFTLPSSVVTSLFTLQLLPLFVANFVGVGVLGRFLCRERKAVLDGRLLQEEAFTDPLTKLPNRRMLERSTQTMFERLRLNDRPVSVMIIDIDRFKQVNDRFGHDVGDVILREVADIVRTSVRRQDAVARFGGEEIVIAMPETDLASASVAANRIRAIVERDVFHKDAATANITVSVGVACDKGPHISFKAVFKAADEALYRAKELGRNRVERAIGPAAMLPA